MASEEFVRSKYFIVPGANDGIGFATAKLLCSLGAAHVTIGCRSQEKIDRTISAISDDNSSYNISGILLDLSSLDSVEKFAESYISRGFPLHGLILNAGIFNPVYSKTMDNFESCFQVNHLSHFYLTVLLLPTLKSSAPSRVVAVASGAYRNANIAKSEDLNMENIAPDEASYSSLKAYANTKMCNILFANEFNSRHAAEGVTAHSLHPGRYVMTNIGRGAWWARIPFLLYKPFAYTVEDAAATEIFVATHPEPDKHPGLYWWRERGGPYEHKSLKIGDQDWGRKLWDLSLLCLKQSRNFSC